MSTVGIINLLGDLVVGTGEYDMILPFLCLAGSGDVLVGQYELKNNFSVGGNQGNTCVSSFTFRVWAKERVR